MKVVGAGFSRLNRGAAFATKALMPHYPRHLSTFDYRGFHRYFLTFCTFERNPYFELAESVALALEQILRACGQHEFDILAYCFMPDHAHLLVEGTREDADLKAFLKEGAAGLPVLGIRDLYAGRVDGVCV